MASVKFYLKNANRYHSSTFSQFSSTAYVFLTKTLALCEILCSQTQALISFPGRNNGAIQVEFQQFFGCFDRSLKPNGYRPKGVKPNSRIFLKGA